MIERVVRYLDGFYQRHTTVKSAVRAVLVALFVAVAHELGFGDVVSDAIP